jgi:hypothetical protein
VATSEAVVNGLLILIKLEMIMVKSYFVIIFVAFEFDFNLLFEEEEVSSEVKEEELG